MGTISTGIRVYVASTSAIGEINAGKEINADRKMSSEKVKSADKKIYGV